MATLEQLKEGIIRAHQAGNLEHARILADAYKAQAAQQDVTKPEEPAAPTEELPDRSIGDIGSDILTGTAKGITSALQAGVGLADIPTGGAVGRALKPYLDLEKLQEGYSKHYSPQQQAALKAVEEAKGFGGTLAAYAENPSAAVSAVGESIPSMLVGGALGRGLGLANKIYAGAAGEGLIGAGAAAESLRERSPDELLSGKDIVSSLGSGITTGVLGIAGGKLADKFGVTDPDTLIAGGLKALKSESANAGEEAAKSSFLKQMVGSGISEGVFEEMPQSAQEQMWANFANDRPITEGVEEAAASGLVAGAAMGGAGGGFNAYQLPKGEALPPPPPEAPETPETPEGTASIMAPTVEALTPQAEVTKDVNDLKSKMAMVTDWLGSNRSQLYNDIMAQDFSTHEGLDKVEELLGGKEGALNARGLSIAEKDLPRLRGLAAEPKAPEAAEPKAPEAAEPKAPEAVEPKAPEAVEPKAPEFHPNIVAAQSALDSYAAKPSLPTNIRAVNEAANTLGIGGNLQNKVAGLQDAVAQAQPIEPAKTPDVNANNQPIAHTLEAIKNFWNWFGDSKVKDTEGKPMVLYHGTDADFDEFDTKAERANRGNNPEGIYLTPDEHEAKGYGKNVMPLYAKAENTYVEGSSKVNQKMAEKYAEVLKNNYPGYGDSWVDSVLVPDFIKTGKFKDIAGNFKTEVMQAGGYDSWRDGRHVIVFNPEQVKSATGNQGTFDVNNPDINASERPNIEETPSTGNKTDAEKEAFATKLGAKYTPGTFDLRDDNGRVVNIWDTGVVSMPQGKRLADAIKKDVLGNGRTFNSIYDALSKSANPFVRQISAMARDHERGKTLWYNTAHRLKKTHAGVYVRPHHAIKLAKNYRNAEDVMAHEIIHGLTVDAIDNPTEEQKPIVEALNKLFNTVKSHRTLQGHYGLTNLKEFVAEGMSNPEFQYLLSKIPYENTNLWDRFTKLIADLLGLAHDNALTELIGNTESLVDAANKPIPSWYGPQNVPPRKPRPPKAPKPPKTPPPAGPPMGGPLVTPKKNPLQKAVDYVETMLFSPDTAVINGLERSMRRMNMPFSHIKKVMLASSTAQAVHSAYLGAQGVIQGVLTYNPKTYMWEASMGANINSIKAGDMRIAQQYGLDPKEAMEQFQNIMEARRVKEIHEKANEVQSTYETLMQENPKKAAAYRKANIKILQLSKRMAALQMTEEEANDILDEAQGAYPEFFEKEGPIDIWGQVRDNTVKMLVDSGRYSRNQAEALMEAAAYVPFQRVMDAEDPDKVLETIYKGNAHSLLSGRKQYGIKGSAREIQNIIHNMEQWQAHSYAIGVKNHKALQLVDATQMYMPEGAVREVKPGTPGAIMVYRHGKKEYYQFADPLFYYAFNGMQGVTTDSLRFGSKYAALYQNFIVRNPIFTLAQLPQDTYAAMFTSGLKNPLALPLEVAKQFTKTLSGKETAARKALTSRGIVGDTGFNTIDAHEMNLLLGVRPEETKRQKVNKWLSHFSEMGDAAVRQAVYERTLKEMKALPDAEAMASQRAADIINFRRQGASATSNMIRQVVPFYGAYLQATRVAVRTLSGRGLSPSQREEAYKALAATAAQTVALGALYAFLAGDDDEFKNMSPQERDNNLIIPGTGFKIPLRRDWTLLPHVIGMHAYTQILDKGTEDPDTAKRAMKDAFLNAAFAAPATVPAVIKPVVEVALNHDLFTGREIESAAMDRLELDEKYTPTTSMLGRLAGKAGIMSPVNFDHLFKGVTGALGSSLLIATDAALGKAFDFPYTEKTTNELMRAVPGVSSIYNKEVHSGDISKFYNLLNEVVTASTTLNRKEGSSPQEVEAYAEKKGKLIDKGLSKDLNKIRQTLHDISQEERRIANIPNKEMLPAQKRAAIEELKQYKKEALADIQQIRNYVYRD